MRNQIAAVVLSLATTAGSVAIAVAPAAAPAAAVASGHAIPSYFYYG